MGLYSFDEYHYRAWRENAKELFEAEDKKKRSLPKARAWQILTKKYCQSKHKHIYIFPAPFRAIASGEFIEEQIYNWTYSDEQRAKESWKEEKPLILMLPCREW